MPPKMILILAHTFEVVRLTTICLVAIVLTTLADLTEIASLHPALTATLAGVLTAYGVKYIEKWADGRNKSIKTADKVLELEHADKKELREQHAKLMAEKEAWWKLQNDRTLAEKQDIEQHARLHRREARETNRAAVNELMRLHNIILTQQRTLVMNGLPVPEMKDINLTQFMLPTWESEDEDEHTTVG
jgi:uncharacterized membrane protein YhiD involved in acid resistance